MKNMLKKILLCSSILSLSVCVNAEQKSDQKASAVKQIFTASSMIDYSVQPWGEAAGYSFLTRRPNGISMTGTTTGLKPNHAYSIWWVVYNIPQECMDGNGGFDTVGCGNDEIGNPVLAAKVRTSMVWGGGTISDSNGFSSFQADLKARMPLTAPMMGPGLLFPMTAEIRFLLKDHGPIMKGKIDKQVYSFDYGCDVYACTEPQGSVHKVPSAPAPY